MKLFPLVSFLIFSGFTQAAEASTYDHSFKSSDEFLASHVRGISDPTNPNFYGSATLVAVDDQFSYWVTNRHVVPSAEDAHHLQISGSLVKLSAFNFEVVGLFPGKDITFIRVKEDNKTLLTQKIDSFEKLTNFLLRSHATETNLDVFDAALMVTGLQRPNMPGIINTQISHAPTVFPKTDWEPTHVARLKQCPAMFLRFCYYISMRLGGFSGGAVLNPFAINGDGYGTLLGIVSHISPLSDGAFVIPWEEIISAFERGRKVMLTGNLYEELNDDSGTFAFQDPQSVRILKGPWKDAIVADKVGEAFISGGDGSGAGGDGSGGGGLKNLSSRILEIANQNIVLKGLSSVLMARDGVTVKQGTQTQTFNRFNESHIRGVQDFISTYRPLPSFDFDTTIKISYENETAPTKISFAGKNGTYQASILPLTETEMDRRPMWRIQGAAYPILFRSGIINLDQGSGVFEIVLFKTENNQKPKTHYYKLSLAFNKNDFMASNDQVLLEGNYRWLGEEAYGPPTGKFFLALRKSIYHDRWELKLVQQSTDPSLGPEATIILGLFSPLTEAPVFEMK